MNSIKKNVLLSATALGLVFSFNANAATAVNVLTGINFNQGTSDATLTPEQTDITGSIVAVISEILLIQMVSIMLAMRHIVLMVKIHYPLQMGLQQHQIINLRWLMGKTQEH